MSEQILQKGKCVAAHFECEPAIRTKCEIWSQWTIKTPESCHWRCSCVFILNIEQFSIKSCSFTSVAKKDHIKIQLLKIGTYLSFNFVVTKIRVVLSLAEDGTRMAACSFKYAPMGYEKYATAEKYYLHPNSLGS